MKNKIVLIAMMFSALTLVASGQGASAVPRLSTGNSLYQQCRATILLMDNRSQASDSDYIDNAECIAYISGFMDGYYLGAPAKNQVFCIPDNTASFGVLARLYVQYMDKYPKLLDEDRQEGLVGMLIANYPCPKAPSQ